MSSQSWTSEELDQRLPTVSAITDMGTKHLTRWVLKAPVQHGAAPSAGVTQETEVTKEWPKAEQWLRVDMSRANALRRYNPSLCCAFLMELQMRLVSPKRKSYVESEKVWKANRNEWVDLASSEATSNIKTPQKHLLLILWITPPAGRGQKLWYSQSCRKNVLADYSVTCFYRCQSQTSVRLRSSDPPWQDNL